MNGLQQLKLYAHLRDKGLAEEIAMINEFTKENVKEGRERRLKRRYQWYHAHCHCCGERNAFVCAFDNDRAEKPEYKYHVCDDCLMAALFDKENKQVKKDD